jgi:predicted MFS family arabinose efflux permease
VRTSIRDPNIWRLYRAVLVLGIAYGLAVAVIALHLDALHFGEESIGGLAAWFALGIVVLSIPSGRLIRFFGAKRTLAGALAGYATSVTIFPLLTSFTAIAIARFVDGACSACLWVSFETILLRRSDPTNKAEVMSLYAMAMAIGYVLGPLGAKALAGHLPLTSAFLASGVLAAGASAYVALRLQPDPRDLERDRPETQADAGEPTTSALGILARIKTSCFATFAYGYFEASVVLFLPLYLMHEKGIARELTIAIPAFFAGGMLLFSNIAGRLGDRHGHLFLMRILATIGGAMILGFVGLKSFAPMAAAVFVAGATLASISPVSLALQGVVSLPRDYDRANGIYNAFYAAGILVGPPISSLLFSHFGGAAMLFHLAALWAAFIVFSVVFAGDDPRSSARNRSPVHAPGARAGAVPADIPSSPTLGT